MEGMENSFFFFFTFFLFHFHNDYTLLVLSDYPESFSNLKRRKNPRLVEYVPTL